MLHELTCTILPDQTNKNYVPQHGGGVEGDIVFSADPVGVSVGVATCLHSISLLNGQILAKLTQIYHWEGEKC